MSYEVTLHFHQASQNLPEVRTVVFRTNLTPDEITKTLVGGNMPSKQYAAFLTGESDGSGILLMDRPRVVTINPVTPTAA